MIYRVSLYLFGLFLITIGINLSIVSGLGISPISAFIYPMSQSSNMNLGFITTNTYVVFVVIQMILLKKNFKLKNILQIPFSIIFGMFINIGKELMETLSFNDYLTQFVVFCISLLICAIGAAIYMTMDIVPNPPEGLLLAICERFKWPFGKVKVISDCLFVSIGIFISITYLGNLSVIREGTIISALFTGSLIAIVLKKIEKSLIGIAFEKNFND